MSRARDLRDERRWEMVALMRQDDEALQRRRAAMASNTLKVGKRRVPKFPEVAGRDERIADLRKKMTDLYDASVAEASRIEGMTPKVDGRRFPGGAR